MGKYKLTDKKRNGFKAFPKALVEGIFWDKVKQKLSDVLENLQSRVTALEAGGGGGGGGSTQTVLEMNGLFSIVNYGETISNQDDPDTDVPAMAAERLGITKAQLIDLIEGSSCPLLSAKTERPEETSWDPYECVSPFTGRLKYKDNLNDNSNIVNVRWGGDNDPHFEVIEKADTGWITSITIYGLLNE